MTNRKVHACPRACHARAREPARRNAPRDLLCAARGSDHQKQKVALVNSIIVPACKRSAVASSFTYCWFSNRTPSLLVLGSPSRARAVITPSTAACSQASRSGFPPPATTAQRTIPSNGKPRDKSPRPSFGVPPHHRIHQGWRKRLKGESFYHLLPLGFSTRY
jgi:hypothetical protein